MANDNIFEGDSFEGDSTVATKYCQALSGRDWYKLSKWNLTADGHCTHCGTALHGRFDPQPGRWGSRRQPVSL